MCRRSPIGHGDVGAAGHQQTLVPIAQAWLHLANDYLQRNAAALAQGVNLTGQLFDLQVAVDGYDDAGGTSAPGLLEQVLAVLEQPPLIR
ncbi:hypothetical protein D3C86_1880180 [compost metagenome]